MIYILEPCFSDYAEYNSNIYAELINKNIKDFSKARNDGLFMLTGTILGDIGRIVVWGSPEL